LLLRIDWKFDINLIIKLRKRSIIFENNELSVVVPLDPAKGV